MLEKPHRRWFTFRLRTLLVLIAVAAAPLVWVSHTHDWIRNRQDAIGLGHLGFLSESPRMTSQWAAKALPTSVWLAHKFCGMAAARWLYRAKDSLLTKWDAERLFPEAIIAHKG